MVFDPKTRTPGVAQRATLVNEGGISQLPNRVALLAYRGATGGSKGATLDNTPTVVTSRAQVTDWFAIGSQADLMTRDAFETGTLARRGTPAGDMPELVIVPLIPPVGTVALYTITYTGAATAAGFVLIDVLDQTVRVEVADLATPTDVAAASDTALLTVEPDLPLTASSALGVVTLTTREPGEWGNNVFLQVDVSNAPGIIVAIAGSVPGVGVTVLTTALANLVNEQFIDSVVSNQSDAASRTSLIAHINDGWDFLNDRPRIGIFPSIGDSATAQTDASAIDDWRIAVTNGEQLTGVGQPYTPDSARSMAAFLAASVAIRLSSRPDRPNANNNQKTIAGVAFLGQPARALTDNTLDGGVTPLVGGGTARILRPVSSAITDQTANAGPTPAPDKRWQPIEIAYVVLNIWRDMRSVLNKYSIEDVTADVAQRAKMDALAKLRAREKDDWIKGITNDSAIVTLSETGGSNKLKIELTYSVLVNIDVIAVEHKVQR